MDATAYSNRVCPVCLCLWQVGGGLSSEVLQQPAWHPFWPQIHHISIRSAQVNIRHLHLWSTRWWTWAQVDICFFCCCRFVQYKATSLEKQHKHELLTEPDLGVTIDLINPDTYRIDPNSESPVVTCYSSVCLIFFIRANPALSNICADWIKQLHFQYCWIPLMKNCWKRTSRLHPAQRGTAARWAALCCRRFT